MFSKKREKDQIINHTALSLDFWQDTVTYGGCTMSTGSIGCEVLNIPDSTIEKLEFPCNVLNQLLQGVNTGSADPELLPPVQQTAKEIISLLQATPPKNALSAADDFSPLTHGTLNIAAGWHPAISGNGRACKSAI